MWPSNIRILLLFQSHPSTAFDVSGNHMYEIGLVFGVTNFSRNTPDDKRDTLITIDYVIELFNQLSIYIGKRELKENFES